MPFVSSLIICDDNNIRINLNAKYRSTRIGALKKLNTYCSCLFTLKFEHNVTEILKQVLGDLEPLTNFNYITKFHSSILSPTSSPYRVACLFCSSFSPLPPLILHRVVVESSISTHTTSCSAILALLKIVVRKYLNLLEFKFVPVWGLGFHNF
jgi:hypothetical protein